MPTEPTESAAPERIGPYRILATLGEGGMGTVYLAQQDEPVRRRVALKVIKLGMDSKQVLARFEAERQALAMMNHDNIARVFEAGTTDRGQPYFVMEHVEGIAITDYCDRHKLTIAQRIELFQQACAGVQHAHQKGVIHRDLKPGNILVTRRDDRATPKIIDFGLARATGQQLIGQSLFTEHGQVVGTPEYMSPEQASFDAQGVDTRTDIYSLGVVLYELLVGELPFSRAELRRAGMLEIQRKICEDPPPKPSTRVTALGAAASANAERRQTSLGGFTRELRGDLDWIVLKAMAKEPERRYESATGLTMDLRRHLLHEPVLAGPAGASYRLRKFVRKHRVQVVAAALVLVTLLAGVIGTTWFAFSAAEQRDFARQTTRELLRLSDDERIEDHVAAANELWPVQPQRIHAMEQWLVGARELAERLPVHLAALEAIRHHALPPTAADAEIDRRERAATNGIGQHRGRLEFLQRALLYRETGRVAEPPLVDWTVLPAQAAVLNVLAWHMVSPRRRYFGEEARAVELARRAVELAPGPEVRCTVLDTLAWALQAVGRDAEARTACEEVVALATSLDRPRQVEFMASLRARIAADSDPGALDHARAEVTQLQASLARLLTEAATRSTYRFEDVEVQWQHDVLAALVRDLHTFTDRDPSVGTIANVEHRLLFARSVAHRSLEAAAAAWNEATTRIADKTVCPQYEGLQLQPQLGLVPIGADPHSGLWEFAHLQTGTIAGRDEHRRLVVTGQTGLVFVLIPGGTFRMGSPPATPAERSVDSREGWWQQPAHEIRLAPFFLSKFEMTQGQWRRFTGKNPSTYAAGHTFRGDCPSDTHPVESVTWHECDEVLRRLGLCLPTEAQWEYAARAGTTSPWWTGGDPADVATAGKVVTSLAPTPVRTAALRDLPGMLFQEWLGGSVNAHDPVGSYRANAFGMHDTVGNVWEWCRDHYGSYVRRVSPGDGERDGNDGETRRTLRGGSFVNDEPSAKSALRNPTAPEHLHYSIGLRPALRIGA